MNNSAIMADEFNSYFVPSIDYLNDPTGRTSTDSFYIKEVQETKFQT